MFLYQQKYAVFTLIVKVTVNLQLSQKKVFFRLEQLQELPRRTILV